MSQGVVLGEVRNITDAGRKLAEKLAPALGYTRDIAATCSLIARHERTYHRLQEDACNGYLFDWEHTLPVDEMNRRMERRERAAERKEAQIEARISALVESLPHADGNENGPGGAWRVEFQGDPRGACVKLIAPAGWESLGDWFGGDGRIVV